ncbi:MAG: alpha/beta hydrolase [Pseudomonadota bacterium]
MIFYEDRLNLASAKYFDGPDGFEDIAYEDLTFVDLLAPSIFPITSPKEVVILLHTAVFFILENRPLEELPEFLKTVEAPPPLPDNYEEFLQEIFEREDGTEHPLFSLYTASAALLQAWTEPNVNPDALNAVFLLPDPGGSEEMTINPEKDWTVWMMTPGSLTSIVTTVVGVLKPIKWALVAYSTLRGRFTSAHQAATWIKDGLRQRASQHETNQPLTRLDDPSFETLLPEADYDAHIIYLHGLFSTDAATFDGFRNAWHAQAAWYANTPGIADCADQIFSRVGHIGWPHDTLVPIDKNAGDLAKLISQRFGHTKQKLVFVCHSRGGLVARKAIQWLYFQDAAKWSDQIRGVVTFGTPHEGAELATYPGRYEGAYVLLLLGTKQLVTLDKLLVYLSHRKTIDGVDDLAPVSGKVSMFLQDLEQEESQKGRPALATVAGDVTGQPLRGFFMKRLVERMFQSSVSGLIGHQDHDLVVRMQSAEPPWSQLRLPTDCNHFGYFDASQSSKLKRTSLQIVEWLDLVSDLENCTKNKTDKADHIKTVVDGDDVYLEVDGSLVKIDV